MRWRWLSIPVAVAVGVPMTGARSQVSVSGLLSMVGRNSDTKDLSNKTNAGFSQFDAIYGRLFFDAAVSDRLAGFVQVYFNGYGAGSLYGAYIRYDHTPNLHLEAGLIPQPVGQWGARTYPDKNPLIAVPAVFQYKTSLDPKGDYHAGADDLLDDRGKNEYVPLVYDFCWNTGIHGYASVGQFDFGLAAMNGSLGSPSRSIIYNRPSVAAHVNFVPGPWLTVGVWSAIGPYLSPQITPTLPAGKKIEDYQQKTVGALLHVSEGHWDGYAEALINRFEHPFLGNLDNVGGYADLRFNFATRWWVAARCDALSFSRLKSDDADVDGWRWDYPIGRLEAGLGRRMTERALLKAVVQIGRYQNAPHSLDDEIYAVQFTVKL